MRRFLFGLVVCATACAVWYAEALGASTTVTVDTGEILETDIVGPGIEDDVFLWCPWNSNFGLTATDYLQSIDRIRKIEPDYARAFVAVNTFLPKDGVYDWDSYGMESLYHHLDIYEEIGATVALTGYQKHLPRWMVAYATTSWDPDHQALADALAELAEHLLIDKGYTCVREIIVLYGPDWGLAGGISAYKDLLAEMHSALLIRNIRHRIKLNGPDCFGPNDTYFNQAISQCDHYIDVYNDNFYNDPLDVAADVDQRKLWIDTIDPDDDTEPFNAGNFNAKDVSDDYASWDYAFWTADMAVTMLGHGASACVYWEAQDHLNGPTPDLPDTNDYGLWNFAGGSFGIRPVYYAYGALISKYVEAGSDLVEATWSDSDLNVAVLASSGGYYTILATNRASSPKDVDFTGLTGIASLREYEVDGSNLPTDNRLALASAGTVALTAGAFSDTLPTKSVTVYTNLPAKSTTAPVISAFAATQVGKDTFDVTWTTNYASDSQLEYANRGNPLSWYTLTDKNLVTSHKVRLSGLMRGATYDIRARSKDHAISDIARSGAIPITTTPGPGFYDDFTTYKPTRYQETISSLDLPDNRYLELRHWCLDYGESGGRLRYDSDTGYDGVVRAWLFRKKPTNSSYLTVELVDATSLGESGGWDEATFSYLHTQEPTWSHGDGYEMGYSPHTGTCFIRRCEDYGDGWTYLDLSQTSFDPPMKFEIVPDRSTNPVTWRFYIASTLVATDEHNFAFPPHYVGVRIATSNATTNALETTWDNLADYDYTSIAAPSIDITQAPSGTVTTTTVHFEWENTGGDVEYYRYKLNRTGQQGTWQNINQAEQIDLVPAIPGTWRFEVMGANAAGTDSDYASFTYDAGETPAVAITDSPTHIVTTAVNHFAWTQTGGEAATRYEYTHHLNGQADSWVDAALNTSADLTCSTEGVWVFRVRGVNDVGTGPADSVTYEYSTSLTAPQVAITQAPSGTITNGTNTFAWEATGGGPVREYYYTHHLTAGADSWVDVGTSTGIEQTCTGAGDWVFKVKGRNAAGDSAVATAAYTYAPTAPTCALTHTPAPIIKVPDTANVQFGWTGTGSFVTFRYRLTGYHLNWNDTSQLFCNIFGLQEGTYTFEVYAVGEPGVGDSAVQSFALQVWSANSIKIRVKGIDWGTDPSTATIHFETNQPATRYYYRIYQLSSTYSSSRSPTVTVTGLGTGYYLIVATARDAQQYMAVHPARVWFYNRLPTGGFQVRVKEYDIAHDVVTVTFDATQAVYRYYYRFYAAGPGYTSTRDPLAVSQVLGEGLQYFVVTAKDAATRNFPPGGPARQWFCINTFGFEPPAPGDAPARASDEAAIAYGVLPNSADADTTYVSAYQSSVAESTTASDGENDSPLIAQTTFSLPIERYPVETFETGREPLTLSQMLFDVEQTATVAFEFVAECGLGIAGADGVAALIRKAVGESPWRKVAVLTGLSECPITSARKYVAMQPARYELKLIGVGRPTLYTLKAATVGAGTLLDVQLGGSALASAKTFRFEALPSTASVIEVACRGAFAVTVDDRALHVAEPILSEETEPIRVVRIDLASGDSQHAQFKLHAEPAALVYSVRVLQKDSPEIVRMAAPEGRTLDVDVVEFASPACRASFEITSEHGVPVPALCDGAELADDGVMQLAEGIHRLQLPPGVRLGDVRITVLPEGDD